MRFLRKFDRWVCNCTHRSLGFVEDRLAPLTLMVLAAVLTPSIWFWDSWRGEESVGMAIRNLGLVIAAIAALPLAIWRSKVAARQAATAQRVLLYERYQKGAEMLGSAVLPVRLGGIYALGELAREHTEDYHTNVMSLLCAFVRNPVWEAGDEASGTISGGSREDVQDVMTTIHIRTTAQIEKEKRENYILHLAHANLKHVILNGANLSGAILTETNLDNAWLQETNLSDAQLFGVHLANANLKSADLTGAKALGANLLNTNLASANLTGAHLPHANLDNAWLADANLNGTDLTGASLKNADLTGTDLRNCKGLTQDQIDQAAARQDIPPKLEGAVDATTGEPLKWLGRPIYEAIERKIEFR